MSRRRFAKMNWTRIMGQFWLLTVNTWLLAQDPGPSTATSEPDARGRARTADA